MSQAHEPAKEPIPLGQRIFESPFLLLMLGFLVPAISYTLWGLIEIFTLPPATLP